ncbi:MAG: SUMF1/EgtB/PvdO family nonheme iron enzyme [Planctomycetaceae bacterium]|nr:SUMF1/EgtB/PvdO family nonheme iron enzyme [Planctomycetaceae bacterium]
MMKKITSISVCLVGFLVLCTSCSSSDHAPPPPSEAASQMDLGLRYLEDSDWQRADSFFDEVLRIDSTYAPAYIGKLCAELRVPKKELLADLNQPIDEHRYFRWAIRDADAAYKRQIQGYADKIRERFGDAGKREVLTINGIEYAFRWCPPGTFMMGDEPGEVSVTLSRGFWMLETEVTQAMWMSVMGNNPSSNKGLNLPVTDVSWNDCQEFITKLNAELKSVGRQSPGGTALAGYKFSLPTEAQWEYACRAGTTTAFHFGDTLTQQQANFGSRQTRDVGSFPANAWGLKDMHGNVWEWCLDRYGDYPSGAVTDPMGPDRGSDRVLRGGGWYGLAGHCRSAFRYSYDPADRDDSIGLRLSLVFE